MIKLTKIIKEQIYKQPLNKLIEDINNADKYETLIVEYIGHINSKSPISYYIKHYKPLDQQEENELIKKYQRNKDSRAFDRLIRAHSKAMLSLIMKNRNKLERIDPNITTEEVFNVMITNFAKAIKKFKPEKGNRFSTYLQNWLQEVIYNYKHFISKSSKIMQNRSSSMDMKIGKGSGKKRNLSDLIADPDAVDLYTDREKNKFMQQLSKKGFPGLNKKERFIIKAKYGMLDPQKEKKMWSHKGKITNQKIGDYLGITGMRVQQLHRTALKKLKKILT